MRQFGDGGCFSGAVYTDDQDYGWSGGRCVELTARVTQGLGNIVSNDRQTFFELDSSTSNWL